MRKIINYLNAVIIFFIMSLMITCHDNPTKPKTGDSYQHHEQSGIVGRGGGLVEITDENSELNGTKLDILEGALDNEVNVSISKSTKTEVHGDKNAIIVDLQPSGTKFSKPVKLTLPYKLNFPGKPPKIYVWDDENKYWQPCRTISINEKKQTVTAEIWHFSDYAAINEDVIIDNKLYRTTDNKIAVNFKLLNPLESFHPYNSYGAANIAELLRDNPEEVTAYYCISLIAKKGGYFNLDYVLTDRVIKYKAQRGYSVEIYDQDKDVSTNLQHLDFNGVKKLYSGEYKLVVFDDYTPDDEKEYFVMIKLYFLSPGYYPSNIYGGEGYCDSGYDYAVRLKDMPLITTIDKNSNLIPDRLENVEGAPTASFTVTPAVGGQDTEFQCDASDSRDTEDDFSDLLFSWDWENDGIWDIENSTNYQPKHKYSADGDYTIKLQVTDTDGNVGITYRKIEVFSNPVVTFKPITGVQKGDVKVEFTVHNKPYDVYDISFVADYLTETGQNERIVIYHLKDVSAGEYNGAYTIFNIPAGDHSMVWESAKDLPINSKQVKIIATWSQNGEGGIAGISQPFELQNSQKINHAPNRPSYPGPANNAPNVYPVDRKLYWSCSDPDGDHVTYDVYFGKISNPIRIKQNISTTYYNVGNLQENTTYYWKIVARDVHGAETEGPLWTFTTGWSQQSIPAAPSNVYAVYNSSNGAIELHWTDNSDNESGFTIERAVDFTNSDFHELVAVDANMTSYTDADYRSDHFYTYRIKAYNNDGESDYSNKAIVPKAPENLKYELTDNGIALNWIEQENSATDRFYIYCSTNNGAFNSIGYVNNATHRYEDQSVQNGNSYKYYVAAAGWCTVNDGCKRASLSAPTNIVGPISLGGNTPPVADFTVTPASGDLNTDFSFDPSSSYDNEDPTSALQVRWDWENDGRWDTGFFSMQAITHRYTTKGTKTVKLEVKDTGDLTDTKTRTVTVTSSGNSAPTAAFTVSPTYGTTDTDFQFDASASSDNEDSFSQLRFSWDWEDDGNWDLENSTNYTPTHRYSAEGTYNVRLRVTDSDGAYDETTESITVGNAGYETGTMTDQDGNVYKTIKIGNQWWMAENLKVTHYRNGDPIPNVTDNSEWANLTTGAYCAYNNDNNNVATYGLLYNWYAVTDSRNIAPEGWHVPTDEEWKELEMYLGMSQSEADGTYRRGTDEGSKLKATSGWDYNGNGTNKSGFTALPGGSRHIVGTFHDMGCLGYWWSSTASNWYDAWSRFLYCRYQNIYRYGYDKRYGYSVRLIRDY